MERTDTFASQTELIMEAAVESAVSVLQQDTDSRERRDQLTAVLHVMTREAARQICRVFRELYRTLAMENQALEDKVGHLECDLRSKAEKTQTVYKIKPSDGPASSLDINQPAANPAALAMAILKSAKSRRRASSNPQVPLVIISQPIPGPVEGQSGPAPPLLPEKPDQTTAVPDLHTEVVVEMNQISTDPGESPGGVTSIPVDEDQPTSQFTGVPVAAREDTPSPEDQYSVETETKMETVEAAFADSQPCETALCEEEQKELERKRRRELYKEKSSCDKGFYKAKSLQKHLLSHQLREAQENDPDKLLRCNQCDRKFRLLRQLRVHQASHRLEKTPLRCRVCDRSFTSAGALRYHEVSHAQVKPFMCDVCGKGFTRKKSLREHQTVHTGARPYACPACGKSFSTASNLRVHKRSHSEDRPYKCCECDKAFKCKMGLLQHRVVHSGEKPFMCQTCGLSFGLKYNFQRHLRLHNGEKPFRPSFRVRMRRVKVSEEGGRRRRGALSLDDCRCPVCLELFLEPVTLPCTHTFCKACFLESVDKATLCCPLCRKRVSTWARLNSRTLVDQQLWDQIQTRFPLQCQRRLAGQDAAEDEPGVSVCFPRVSQPGELKQEYEDQVTKLTEEKRALDEEERRASEDYIHRLLAEEEDLQQETTRRHEEDERLARLLSSQLNSAPVSQNFGPATVTPAKKKKRKEVLGGLMEKFLCPLPSNSNFLANKENILVSQEKVECPLSQQPGSDPASASVEVQSHAPTPVSHMTGDGSAKRKSSELEMSEEEEETVTSRGCHSIPSSSSSSLEVGGAALLEIAELEAELLSRHRQEEEDRRLALLLQKELDQQEKQRSTDRRRGSSDPYPLRQHSRRESGNSASPTRPPAKTQRSSTPSSAKTKETPSSSSSSSSSSSRSRKQATLTEMFPGMSG
ncbi:E3 ubiquitin-protein ligase rnf168 isoform X2 [Clinocottus analis]|uniref:E3 ubiquitin-protein ligase rnf168 isoform X2 n=1 Tax=Clinocottus analis TaxID=304258 RepID=UPI0035BFF466